MRGLAVILCLCALWGCGPQPELRLASAAAWQPYLGQWRVLNVWATWCAPCREEVPVLNEYQAAQVLGWNFDNLQGAALTQAQGQLQVAFPEVSLAVRALFDLPQVLPTTWVIDPCGEVWATLIGPQSREALDMALAQAKEQSQCQLGTE